MYLLFSMVSSSLFSYPTILQAMLMVDRGEATVTDIDLSMQLGAGHPMGPLHLADYIGNQPVQCRVV